MIQFSIKVKCYLNSDNHILGDEKTLRNRRTAGLVFGAWMVFMLSVAVFGVVLNVPLAWGTGTITIKADGSIDPPDAPIDTIDMITYCLTDNINFTTWDCIVVKKDDIVLDGASYTIQGTGYGSGIDLRWTSNVTIQSMGITNLTSGINLMHTLNSRISGNTITGCSSQGISMQSSSNNNTIIGNTIITNTGPGIFMQDSSNNNIIRNTIMNNSIGINFDETSNSTVSGNTITNNTGSGIYMRISSGNILSGNNIAENYYGITLAGSWWLLIGCSNNKFYHNNIMNNTGDNIDLFDQFGSNVWDDGYPSGGNYWGDYAGVDLYSGPDQNESGSDGIGDTSYVIDADNQDRYPFMNPWTDTNPPETTISLSGVLGDNDWFTSDVTVTLSATDDTEVDKTEYSFDNAAWNIYTAPFVLTSEGTTTVYYKSTDKAGNPETAKTRAIKIDKTDPSANAGVDQTVNEDTVVTFDGSASTDTNGIATYTWTFTDVTLQTLSGQTPTYTFATPGTYTVTAEVADPAGNTATDTVAITVVDVTNPVANAGQDQTVNAGATVTFDAGGSTDNVVTVSYEWDFGDGTSGTGTSVTHEFPNAGTYTVTLTVEDAAGNQASDTMIVTVRAAEGFPTWIVAVVGVAAVAIAAAAIILWKRRR